MHAIILKKRNKIYFFLLLLIGVFNSCIDPINVKIDSESGQLVVDGSITDQIGPYEIKLSLSSDYFDRNSNPFSNKVSGAEISILDSKGISIQLEEISNGTYQTPTNFKGEVGNSYVLNIKLNDGREYKSLPEKLLPNVGIETLRTEYLTKKRLNENDVEVMDDGMFVTVDTNPLNENDPYYRWRFIGTYEYRAYPENKTKVIDNIVLADPPPCSGWVPINGGLSKAEVAPCTCCYCWITEVNTTTIVSKVNFIQGNIRNVNISFIKNQDSRFEIRYHIYVEQLSLTKQSYDFWNAVAKQNNQGSIFDIPIGILPTNLYCVNNPDEIVLGNFSASSIKSKSKSILTSDIPVIRRVFTPPINADCRVLENSTNVKPPFW